MLSGDWLSCLLLARKIIDGEPKLFTHLLHGNFLSVALSDTENQLPTNTKVLKFGGTSVEDWPAFERAAQIVRANASGGLVVIVSAMGGVTDALIRSFRRGTTGETAEALQSLEHHFERHLTVAQNLGASRSPRSKR